MISFRKGFLSVCLIVTLAAVYLQNTILHEPQTPKESFYLSKVNMSSSSSVRGGIRALVIGGTGAIGKEVVKELTVSPRFNKVTVVLRRDAPELPDDPKLEKVVLNMDRMEDELKINKGDYDVSFCCLGTTKKDAGSAEEFKKVDLGYVSRFGRISKDAEIPSFHLVSSQGANKDSWFLYMETKGKAEEEIKSLGFKHTSIYRPGLLDRGEKSRAVEKLAKIFVSGLHVNTVAKAMKKVAEDEFDGKLNEGVRTFYNNDINGIAH
eukprot:TRINITY_DN1820_c0_g1_i1.p1 TRINITY_DN1820_c0_g1~~TRINITY_DN1820_c0_g1_i1.p1  ORF type:complete len:265 (+),score=49.33 TRINITY_DN1820_c0_g1_i1:192-986(+)